MSASSRPSSTEHNGDGTEQWKDSEEQPKARRVSNGSGLKPGGAAKHNETSHHCDGDCRHHALKGDETECQGDAEESAGVALRGHWRSNIEQAPSKGSRAGGRADRKRGERDESQPDEKRDVQEIEIRQERVGRV